MREISGARPDERSALIARALRLSWLSVSWAVMSGTASVAVGVFDRSVGVTAVGLNLLGDLVGSLVLVWRFTHAGRGAHLERRSERWAGLAVATALALTGTYLVVQSIRHLVEGIGPSTAGTAVAVAAASALVLPPLARAKRRVGAALDSRALRGDGTLSGVGAALAAIALVGLLVNRAWGWWWADSAAALTVALVAATQARLLVVGASAHGSEETDGSRAQ